MNDLVEEARLDAKAFRENTVYDSGGNPIRLTATADRLDAYATALATAQTEAAELRAAILAKHNHRCTYCQTSEMPLEMDHVISLSKGGPHCATNIVPACKPCNSSKGNR